LNLAWTELRQGKTDRALARFRRLPEDGEALRGAAKALMGLGRHAEAVAAYERALALSPESARLRYELDRARAGLRKPKT
jgi:tetratricopeptide (TPR) repeat protein